MLRPIGYFRFESNLWVLKANIGSYEVRGCWAVLDILDGH